MKSKIMILVAGWLVAGALPGRAGSQVSPGFTLDTRSLSYAASNIVVDAAGPGNVNIRWDGLPVVDEYRVWRSTSDDWATAVLIGSTTNTSYQDTEPQMGSTYYYWLTALNQIISGEPTGAGLWVAVMAKGLPWLQLMLDE